MTWGCCTFTFASSFEVPFVWGLSRRGFGLFCRFICFRSSGLWLFVASLKTALPSL